MPKVALALAAFFAALFARRAPSKRQTRIAWALVGLFSLDVLRYVSIPLRASPPYAGIARASWAVSGGAALGWYALTAWAAWTVLGREEPRPVRFAFAMSWPSLPFALFAAYPAIRGEPFVDMCRGAFALALAAQLLAFVRWLSRGVAPDDAQRVALVLIGSSIVDLAPGPWMLGDPVRDWYAGHWPAIVTWLIVAGWEAKCLICAHRSPE